MSKILGPGIGYVDLLMDEITEVLTNERDTGKNFQRTPIRPSASGKCARELYFELMMFSGRAKYEVPVMTPETHFLLGLGHHIERHFIENIRKHMKISEVKFTQQILDFGPIDANDKKLVQRLEGSMDLCLWSEKYKCAVDIKSKGDNYNFKSRKMKWDEDTVKLANMKSVLQLSERAFWVADLPAFLEELDDPFFQANFKQLNLYMGSDFLQQRAIDHGAIFQYHKNKSKIREVRFKYCPKTYKATVAKFRNVVKAVDEDKPDLAPKEYPEGCFKCRYCNFQKACWGKKS